jgi:hypothetical protein
VFILQRQAVLPILELPQQVESIQRSDLDTLVETDAKIFGADRSQVFSALLQAYPDRAFFSKDTRGQITGYLFMQEGRIGPWVILEPDDEEALLHAALSLDFAGISAVVPEINQRALELLRRYDFEIVRMNRHMARGSATTIGQRDKVYTQTSLSLG